MKVPVRIAWFLISVAVIAGLAFFMVRAAYLRYFAKPRLFAPAIPVTVPSEIPARVPRHSRLARLFRGVMAATMLTLLVPASFRRWGIHFAWVTYHRIAGAVLIAWVDFHFFHASFWLDFFSIWPDRIDRRDTYCKVRRSSGVVGTGTHEIRKISARE